MIVSCSESTLFYDSVTEVPGLAVAAYIVDRWGRKRSMAALFTSCGAFLVPLVHVQSADITTFLLFGARACIMGAFTVLYIYAPEVFLSVLLCSSTNISFLYFGDKEHNHLFSNSCHICCHHVCFPR